MRSPQDPIESRESERYKQMSTLTFRQEIERKIALQYSAQSRTIDYPGLVRLLVAILKAQEFSRADQMELVKQAIEAYTRQGYFV
jgi:hypothetical protein